MNYYFEYVYCFFYLYLFYRKFHQNTQTTNVRVQKHLIELTIEIYIIIITYKYVKMLNCNVKYNNILL